jgi:hypothetical protein
MANEANFDINSRHVMSVVFNGVSGLCDVAVTDKQSPKTFVKSMMLDQYNRLVDWLRDNDHSFAMNSIHSYF